MIMSLFLSKWMLLNRSSEPAHQHAHALCAPPALVDRLKRRRFETIDTSAPCYVSAFGPDHP